MRPPLFSGGNSARGCAASSPVRASIQLDAILSALTVLPIEAPADAVYGRIRTHLEQSGQPIGGNDVLIAAQAVALGHTLVTDNEREFARVPDLHYENWLRPAD